MYNELLVFCLLLSSVLSTPLYDQDVNRNESKRSEEPSVLGINKYSSNPKDAIENSEGSVQPQQSKDLTAQETFYPGAGVWWSFRPWGGWGGWGGYRPWHGPKWGGHWGGHWGGGRWGRSS